MTPGGTLQTEPPFVFVIGEKETLPESCQTFKVATAQTSGLPYYRKLTLHEIKVLEIKAT